MSRTLPQDFTGKRSSGMSTSDAPAESGSQAQRGGGAEPPEDRTEGGFVGHGTAPDRTQRKVSLVTIVSMECSPSLGPVNPQMRGQCVGNARISNPGRSVQWWQVKACGT
jgi:hypothetical protein